MPLAEAAIQSHLPPAFDAELVEDACEAIRRCLERSVDHLFLPVKTVTSGLLTALGLLKDMRPELKVTIVGEDDLSYVLDGCEIADDVRALDADLTLRRLGRRGGRLSEPSLEMEAPQA